MLEGRECFRFFFFSFFLPSFLSFNPHLSFCQPPSPLSPTPALSGPILFLYSFILSTRPYPPLPGELSAISPDLLPFFFLLLRRMPERRYRFRNTTGDIGTATWIFLGSPKRAVPCPFKSNSHVPDLASCTSETGMHELRAGALGRDLASSPGRISQSQGDDRISQEMTLFLCF